MSDTLNILAGYEGLEREQMRSALATIVAVEGSSYRRLGAKMLIGADGRRWGGVSGGCLEADVARRARIATDTNQPCLCRYETSDPAGDEFSIDDEPSSSEPGVSLGCGGALEIFIEPATAEAMAPLLQATKTDRPQRAALVYRVGGDVMIQAGSRFGSSDGSAVFEPGMKALDATTETSFRRFVLDCGWIDVLLEVVDPPQRLVIIGDGFDVDPLVTLATNLGWRTTVVARKQHPTRFAPAEMFQWCTTQRLPSKLLGLPTVLMNHDLRRDASALRELARSDSPYIGVLGPLHRTQRLLTAAGIEPSPNFFAPAGLSLGGEGPAQVALSIISEIQAVLARREPCHLRDRNLGIHQLDCPQMSEAVFHPRS